ncbi:MAG: S8 family serine peptidase, partial [Planctomycetes bacterium]|nr:S8 family serine peptidase [Planctomycetota bacterium]
MSPRLFKSAIWTVTIVSGLVMPFGVRAQKATSVEYHYRYFDQAIALERDPTRIAMFESALEPNPAAALKACAAKCGLNARAMAKSQVPTMWMMETGALARDAAGAEKLVSTIAADDDVGFVSPVFLDGQGEPVIITQYIHVGFSETTTAAAARALLASMGAGQIEASDWAGMAGVYRVKAGTRNGFGVLRIANAIAAKPGVKFAEPDMVKTSRRSLIPNDTFFDLLWGLHNTGQSGGTVDMDMDGPEAWDLTIGDPAIITVILDDGTQQDHPDINQIPGADFTGSGTGGGPFNQCDNHGTAVAGCTSAIINNALGVVGSAPGCKIAAAKWSISTLGNPCPGTGSFAISWFVNALSFAESIGAKVTNNSNGFGPSASITTKYQQTRDAGIVHFASAGNDGTSVIGYPANLPTVNAVGAINRFGNKASFSTFGVGLAFMAPGQSIASTDRTGNDGYVGGDYVLIDGTSFSSPYAAGVAALVFSVDNTLVPDDVEQILNSTATDRGAAGYDTVYGWGILNLFGAVQAAMPQTITLSGSCFYDVAMANPVNTVAVEILNLDTGASFVAGTVNNAYTLDLEPTTDISDGDTLRYIAKDGVEFINVTDRLVTQADLMAGNIVLDLVLDEFYLDLADFPMYEADGPNHNDFSGAAVAQMVLNYIWWDSDIDPTPPLLFDDQSVLYDLGISLNATPALSVFDPVGMRATIQNNRPLPYSQFGYNFSIRQDTDSTEILKQIAQWVAYEIGEFGGLEPGHPEHVPGVIPAYGDYSNWMAVRGI